MPSLVPHYALDQPTICEKTNKHGFGQQGLQLVTKAEDTRNSHPLNPRVTLALAYISISILRFCDSNERNQKMELIFEYWKQDWKTKILRNAL